MFTVYYQEDDGSYDKMFIFEGDPYWKETIKALLPYTVHVFYHAPGNPGYGYIHN